MKTKISILVASLLFTSTALLANSYTDGLVSKEAKALNNPKSIHSRAADAKVEESISKEAFLAKVNAGAFKKEVNQEETRRLHSIVNSAVQAHKDSLKKAPKDFMSALNDTIMALHAIKTNKSAEAQKLLQKAENEFTAAFKKEPKLGLIPVLDNAEIVTFNGTPALIRHIKDSAIELLQKNETQAAIDILLPLQDEIIIKTQYVPAYLYPKAVKEAQQELKSGKKDAAFSTIITALDASQLDTVIIPIPFITAQDMVLEASKVVKSDKKEALQLLTMAQNEIQKAILLGYAADNVHAYKALDTKIEALKTEIKGKNVVVKLYDDLLKSFKDLGGKQKRDTKHHK